ncbi:MAG: iron donor protein CyaY [Rhodospirillales bacterium]
MSDADFITQAEREIGFLAERLEELTGDVVDVDYEQDVLSLELDDGAQYVVNRQTPMKQIWLSSPVSGAWHYGRDAAGVWRATRDNKPMRELLSEELSQRLARPVPLD